LEEGQCALLVAFNDTMNYDFNKIADYVEGNL
jgi:hypothetical protein